MQPTVKISGLPKQSAPATTDKAPIVHGNETDYVLLSDLITLFFNNIPSGTIPGITGSYVISGLVWTADSAGVNRNASMSAGSIYINSRTIALLAVTARTFTASRDTYIDILDNLDGTGTLVYTEVTNNNASPALAANSIRIGIIVTGATTIATSASVNQGQEDRVLPIASSVPYTVTDSLGNLICTRDPDHRLLGYRQITSSVSTTNTSAAQATGLSCTVIAPGSRKIEIEFAAGLVYNAGANLYNTVSLWDGTVGSGTQVAQSVIRTVTGNTGVNAFCSGIKSPAAGTKTYNIGIATEATGTINIEAASTFPAYVAVKQL